MIGLNSSRPCANRLYRSFKLSICIAVLSSSAVHAANELSPAQVEAYLHANTLISQAASGGATGTAKVIRQGEITIMADNRSGLILPEEVPEPYDLQVGTRISFMPTGNADNEYEITRDEGIPLVPEGAGATPILVGADELFGSPGSETTVPYSLPFQFPFFGDAYDSLNINWNGILSFGGASDAIKAADVAEFLTTKPKIAAFYGTYASLLSFVVGKTTAEVLSNPNRVVFTYNDVIDLFFTGDVATHQVILYESGRIDLIHEEITTDGVASVLDGGSLAVGIVGISKGLDTQSTKELNFNSLSSEIISADAIYQEFHGNRPYSDPVLQRVAATFYENNPDKYDFLVIFTNFETLTSNNAFFRPLKNEVHGIGQQLFDRSADVGSAGELEGFIYQDYVQQYSDSKSKLIDPQPKKFMFGPQNDNYKNVRYFDASDPDWTLGWFNGEPITYTDVFVTDTGTGARHGLTFRYRDGLARTFGRTRESVGRSTGLRLDASGVGVLAHEIMHRWISPRLEDNPGPLLRDLVGRGGAHWVPFLNNRTPEGQFAGDPRYSVQQGAVIHEIDVRTREDGEVLVSIVRDSDGNIISDTQEITDPDDVFKDMVEVCNDILGQSAFMTDRDQLADGSSALEQYLMGLRTAEQVPQTFYVDNARSATPGFLGLPLDEGGNEVSEIRGDRSLDDSGYCGDRVALDLATPTGPGNLLLELGPRVPAIGDEVDAVINGKTVDVKTMAFILVVPDMANFRDDVNHVERFRQAAEYYLNGPLIGHRNAAGQVPDDADYDLEIPRKFDTRLDPAIH